jgi:tRNA 2-thiouridine synthesizing protein E
MVTPTLDSADILETVAFDDEGFLANAGDWRPEIGSEIAVLLGIPMTERHWTVINFARGYHGEYEEAPTLRQITRQTDVSMKEIYTLFPGGPAKLAAQIAGLKKPTGCI